MRAPETTEKLAHRKCTRENKSRHSEKQNKIKNCGWFVYKPSI